MSAHKRLLPVEETATYLYSNGYYIYASWILRFNGRKEGLSVPLPPDAMPRRVRPTQAVTLSHMQIITSRRHHDSV